MKINNINNIYTNTAINGLYSSMYQGSMSLNSIKLNRDFFSAYNSKGTQQLGEGAMQYVKNIKASSKALSNSIKDLSGPAFAKKTAQSSDPETMTVKYTGNRPNDIKDTNVKIDQIATGQTNEGNMMSATAAYSESGTNKFSISIDGKTTELSVNIAAGESNKAVQQKMADAINKAGLGVKATVEADTAGTSNMLKLEATSTGDNSKSQFAVADVTGNLVSNMGADNISSVAQNALYSINGGAQRTSETNTVDIGNGLNVTFNKASGTDVKITAGNDMGYAKTAVENMVKSYNDLFSEAAQNTNDLKAQNLASKMISISKTYSGSLSSIGIGFDVDGKMTIDSKKLGEAADNGKLERFFTENSGKNYGFTNQLSRLADNVSNNTSNYVSKTQFGNSLAENFAYNSFGNMLSYNSSSLGWLFDYSS